MARTKANRKYKRVIYYQPGDTTEEDFTSKPIKIPKLEEELKTKNQIIEDIGLCSVETLVHRVDNIPLEKYFDGVDELLDLVRLDNRKFLASVYKTINTEDVMESIYTTALKIEMLRLRMMGEEEYLKQNI